MAVRVSAPVDGGSERLILTSLITDTAVVAGVSAKWNARTPPFGSTWVNTIATWCVEHYRKYNRAPGRLIVGYFESWAETTADREIIDLVGTFLASLSAEYERADTNAADYILDLAAKQFTRVGLKRVIDGCAADLEINEIERAAQRVSEFRKVELGSGGFDTFDGDSLVDELFAVQSAPLFMYPGPLGNFFGHIFQRDSFIAFWGMNKVGKSWWLWDVAWRSLMAGNRTAYFVVGDMSRLQVWPRILSRAARRPYAASRLGHGYRVPIKMHTPSGGMPSVDYKEYPVYQGMTADECKEIRRKVVAQFGDNLRSKAWPSRAVSIVGLEAELESWNRNDDWRADTVVVDYFDNLAPVDSREDERGRINTTWTLGRGLSQRWHCCLVTASQADTKSFHTKVLTRENFSGDRRKLDHPTATLGINQTSAEKDEELYRLNFINGRELDFSDQTCCWTAACLTIANPCVCSVF